MIENPKRFPTTRVVSALVFIAIVAFLITKLGAYKKPEQPQSTPVVNDDEVKLTITEGSTIDGMGANLEKSDIFTAQDFIAATAARAKTFEYFGESVPSKNLEGYLFPDTYFIFQSKGPNGLIDKMLGEMDQKITAEMRADIKKQGKTIHEILTMASIIEREVGRNISSRSTEDLAELDRERRVVAGIFYNRLEIGMPLQSDATLQYITRKNSTTATAADVQIDSPYNTYKYRGLPPGPIASPGLSSIMAAIYPTDSNYLYFLMKSDGTAVFSRTLDEHNIAKARYIK